MLVYIIDGFNLLHKIEVLKTSINPHRDLIEYIRSNKLTGSRTNKVIIVFDGSTNWRVGREKEYEVIFSQEKSADTVIKERLREIKNISEVVVVSDDREIKDAAKRLRARVLTTGEFIKRKTKQIDNTQEKGISYVLQREITEELRKVWFGE